MNPVISPVQPTSENPGIRKCLANDRGLALITAISLLAIMSILGTLLMLTSTSEIQLSGNYRNYQESFYAADRGVEYATQAVATGGGTVDLYQDEASPGVLHRDRIIEGRSGLETSTVTADDDRNSVTFLGTGPPPVGSGSDANYFQARNYSIHVVGISPSTANNPTRTAVRTEIAKIVPK